MNRGVKYLFRSLSTPLHFNLVLDGRNKPSILVGSWNALMVAELLPPSAGCSSTALIWLVTTQFHRLPWTSLS